MAILSIDAVIWRDAYFSRKTIMTPDLVELITFGAVVYEDDEKVVLAHEVERSGEFNKKEMNYQGIPKSQIKDRRTVGKVRLLPDGSFAPLRRKKRDDKEIPSSVSTV